MGLGLPNDPGELAKEAREFLVQFPERGEQPFAHLSERRDALIHQKFPSTAPSFPSASWMPPRQGSMDAYCASQIRRRKKRQASSPRLRVSPSSRQAVQVSLHAFQEALHAYGGSLIAYNAG